MILAISPAISPAMRKISILTLALCVSPLSFVSTFVIRAAAEVRTVTIEVDTPFEATDGLGLVIQDGATLQRKIEDSKQIRPGVMAVSFKYESADIKQTSVANAMLWSKDGRVAMGTSRSISNASTLSSVALSSMNTCPLNSGVQVPNQDKIAVLESLVGLRKRVSETLRQKTGEIISEGELERLRRLEIKFGLERETPISIDLPPAILAERLWRIAAAVELFNNGKSLGKPAATQVPDAPAPDTSASNPANEVATSPDVSAEMAQ